MKHLVTEHAVNVNRHAGLCFDVVLLPQARFDAVMKPELWHGEEYG